MYGLTNKEGLMSLGDFNPWIDLMNEDFSAFLPGDLKFESVDEMKEIAEAVKKFYFGNKPIDSNMDMNFVDYQTDTLFVYSMLRNIQLQIAAGDTNIYLYEYSYYEDDSEFQGATHCRQTRAVRDETDDGFSQEYINIKRLLRQAWINFIKTNNPVVDSSPVPSWPNVNKYGSPHLSVGKNIELRRPLIKKKFSFWNSIYEKHYKTPQPPRTFTLNSEAKNSS
uniref:Carboxylesterase type B domain-containing protein n=2 Tax=Bombyx mori TaxID=7091 RepID=A0A8R2C4S9_BOMMO|nr:esterase FE4 [Bombyx mori]